MDNLPAFIMIAPGYLVQAWLFETHRALGGFGYQVTMVGVSALVWSLLILSAHPWLSGSFDALCDVRVPPNKRLKLAARVDYGMDLFSARRSLSAIR